MASTGNVFAGTGESVTRGTGVDWTSPGSVTADDAGDATCVGTAGNGSDYLVARNFNFSAIPAGAVINGILVRVEASEHTGGTEALLAQLQDASGALFGSAKTNTNEGDLSGTSKVVYTFGSTSDAWGATLTRAIVQDADFGVRLWFTTAHDVRIDFVTMAVEYTLGVEAATISSTAALTAPSAAHVIAAAFLASTLALFEPTVVGPQEVTGGTIASSVVLTAPTVAPDQAVSLDTTIAIVGTAFGAGEDGNGGGTLDVAGTVDSQANLGLLFSYLGAGPGETLAGTVQPGSTTAISDDTTANGRTADSSYRTSPSTGSQTQVVTYSNPGAQRVAFGMFAGVKGVDISGSPIRTTATPTTGTDGSPAITVTGNEGDLAVACVFFEENRAASLASGGSEFFNGGFTIGGFANDDNGAACRVVAASALVDSDGSVTFTFQIDVGTGRDWILHGFSLKADPGGRIPSTATLTAPSAAYVVDGAHIASGATLTAPTVTYVVETPTIAAGSTPFAPSATHVVEAPTVAAGSTLFEPTVEAEAGGDDVTGEHVTSTAVLFAPTAAYAVEGATIASGSTLFAPTAEYAVTTAAIAAGSALFEPTVTEEGGISAGHVASTLTLFVPTVTATYEVTSGTIPAGSGLLAPTLAHVVAGATIAAGTALLAPTVMPDGGVTAGHVASTLLFAPTVSGGVFADVINIEVYLRPALDLAVSLEPALNVEASLTRATDLAVYTEPEE